MRGLTLSSIWLVAIYLQPTLAVKRHDFKTCDQAGFCRRARAIAKRAQEAGSSWASPYSVSPESISLGDSKSSFTASVKSSIYPDIQFQLQLLIHDDGVVRVRMDEANGLRKRYDEAASWALINEPGLSKSVKWEKGKSEIKAVNGKVEVKVAYKPLQITLRRDGRDEVVINGQGLLHMEHFRKKPEPVEAPAEPVVESGTEEGGQKVLETPEPPPEPIHPAEWFEGKEDSWWEETFLSWTDTKPKGPESFSLDINFPNAGNVYGIPEHAARLSLPTTTGEEPFYEDPYRLYNLDVFEYEASASMSLYGAIPLLHAHSAHSTVGIFNAVGSETWIDIAHPSKESTSSHWISESGILDLFLLPGPTPADVFAQYAKLTGTPVLPAQWALGYHQCRWNYVSSSDIREVQGRFDAEEIPFDVLWLDIEYAEDHKYFMWQDKAFPDPVDMMKDVEAFGRHMVVIVDPHLKRVGNYPVYKEASDRELLIKPSSGTGEFEGWCWSGSSSWVDFFNPGSWDWWKGLFKVTSNGSGWHWKDSTENLHIWNDMNEPSVFNGPEITMQKDAIHYGGWEHRDVHNINGMLFQNITSQAIMHRSAIPKRPFVLSRAYYAGSQRFGAIWTGDNLGTWEHMAIGVPMTLTNSISGMSFVGADVGGFFGNPDSEMLIRWYHVGAFAPFFRAHAHLDTKRREPYLLDEAHKKIVRDILRLRYSLLSVWYTAFREASVNGMPVMRPQYVVFPRDPKGFAIDEQYYIGSSGLLVKPITQAGVTETEVYIAEDQPYYRYLDHHLYRGAANGRNVTVPAALHQVPLLLRGGSIVPARLRPRRSSTLMKNDPFTLTVTLDNSRSASGELYLDDGETFSNAQGEFLWRRFAVSKSGKGLAITNIDLASANLAGAVDGVAIKKYNSKNAFAKSAEGVRVEKIIVLGLDAKPTSVTLDGGKKKLEWTYTEGVGIKGKKEGGSSVLTIKDPGAKVGAEWTILVN